MIPDLSAVARRPRPRGPRFRIAVRAGLFWCLVHLAAPPPTAGQGLPILDVPFVSQSELLCGGAAAAMILRYWGERGLSAESFAHLVDRSAAGIRTAALVMELGDRGWDAAVMAGSEARLASEVARGRPVLTLIEDRPGTLHYVVVVGMPVRGVIFHDPARNPFRVMTRPEFVRRWNAADRWMAVVLPRRREVSEEAAATVVQRVDAGTPCDDLVAGGVRLAQAGDLDAAERLLTSALSCPGPAAFRELAGVRALQKRWPDAADLAAAATAVDASDAQAWKLLAAARFIQDDAPGALAAWNAVGEPHVDTIQTAGLTRTRARVVEQSLGIAPGDLLTVASLARARRRLSALPAASTSTLAYVPVAGGRAEVRATVVERGLFPASLIAYGTIGASAVVTRDVRVATGSFTGGGERLGAQWRFWPGRPRVALDLTAPAPWGGVWGVAGSWERQPFDQPALPTSERTEATVSWSDWASGFARLTIRGGADRWREQGRFGVLGGAMEIASADDRLTARVDADAWVGDTRFGTTQALVRARSSNARRGPVLVAAAGAGRAGQAAPGDLWFGGDTGRARPVRLRAHPLVDDGRMRTGQLGRDIVHGTGEAQYWWQVPQVSVGAAAFVDVARVGRRLEPGDRGDVDVGVGARFAAPRVGGVLRLDVAKGLRDGRTRVSLVYEP